MLDAGYAARVRRLVAARRRRGALGAHRHAPGPVVRALRRRGRARLGDARRRPALRPEPFPYAYLQPAVGRSFTSFWTNRDGIRTAYVSAYASLAKVLAHEDAVIGYDAMNEPACELTAAPCGLPPQPAAATQYLAPFYRELVPALRRADPGHADLLRGLADDRLRLPVRGPPALSQPGPQLPRLLRPADPHRSVPARRRRRRCATAPATRRSTTPPRSSPSSAPPRSSTSSAASLDGADAAGVGWLYWQYKTYGDPTTSAAVRRTRRGVDRHPGGRGEGRQGARARAGLPDADRGTRRALALWRRRRTLRPALDRDARGADTVVALPRLAYPRGFAVRVHGVRVVRRAPLTLRGSGSASITVTRR